MFVFFVFFLSIRLQTEPDKIFVVHFVMCGYKMCCNQLKDEMKSVSMMLFFLHDHNQFGTESGGRNFSISGSFGHLKDGSTAAHLQHLLIYMRGRMQE